MIFSGSKSPARAHAFTIVEVMMASVILVVGFMGMIQAVTIGSEMIATARNQTLANQILTHEMEKLRLADWATISALGNQSETIYTSFNSDGQFTAAINASGVAAGGWKISRTVTTLTTDLREVTYTVTWTKGGDNNAASTATGTWLEQLAFRRSSPIARTYNRQSSAWFTKYGLNLNLQRS